MGYTTKQLLTHLEETYVDLDELEEDIRANEALLSAAYDPNDSPQEYWARLQNCKRIAIELGDTNVDDVRLMRVAILQFRAHAHLDDAAIEWKKTASATQNWTTFKKHFNKAIQRTKKNKERFRKWELPTLLWNRMWRHFAKTAVHQNETIFSLQAELAAVQAQLHRPPLNLQANSATTPTSVMDMMVEAFKSSQPGK